MDTGYGNTCRPSMRKCNVTLGAKKGAGAIRLVHVQARDNER